MVRRAVSTSTDDPANPPTDPQNNAADLSNDELTDAIAEADSTIDSYIGARYTTPVAAVDGQTTAPHPLDYWSRNIAAYNATLTVRGSQDFTDQDPIARRYNATMSALGSVKSGSAVLPGVAEVADGTSGVGQALNQYENPLFREDEFDVGRPFNEGRTTIQLGEYPFHWRR